MVVSSVKSDVFIIGFAGRDRWDRIKQAKYQIDSIQEKYKSIRMKCVIFLAMYSPKDYFQSKELVSQNLVPDNQVS
jgi:hypothetical protein